MHIAEKLEEIETSAESAFVALADLYLTLINVCGNIRDALPRTEGAAAAVVMRAHRGDRPCWVLCSM